MGVHPTAMRMVLPPRPGETSCRLTGRHRFNRRLSMTGNRTNRSGLIRPHKTAGTSQDHPVGRNRPGNCQGGPGTWDLAQDGRSLAPPVADGGSLGRGRSAPRRGAPETFTLGTNCQIMALACLDPERLDSPVSHRSQSELARRSVARGIAESNSPGSAGRF